MELNKGREGGAGTVASWESRDVVVDVHPTTRPSVAQPDSGHITEAQLYAFSP